MLPTILNKWMRTFRTYRKVLKYFLPITAFISTACVWIYLTLSATTINEKPRHISNEIEYFMTNTIIQPSLNICANNPYLIILVDSYVSHDTLRYTTRSILPETVMANADFVRIFMIGKARIGSPMSQSQIENESHQFGDILQGSFVDDYKNLTYKTLMGLHWVTTACVNATYILKTNDTSILDVKDVLTLLLRLDQFDNNNLLIGTRVYKKIPVRDPQLSFLDPDYVSWDEFGSLYFPPHVSRWFYVTTPQVAASLTKEAPNHKYLFLEDVFVTGILAEAARIPVRDFSEI